MKIKLNGEIKSIYHSDEEISLENLITQLGYQPQLIVVELNGAIINPQNWISTKMRDGDSLEVVTIVGGGSYNLLSLNK